MPIPKLKVFKISIVDDEEFDFDLEALNTINAFLAQSNFVYTDHSISILSDPYYKYDKLAGYNHYLVLSLVYKDLAESPLDLSKTSIKTKELVRKSVETGDAIEMPSIETDFDKRIKKTLKKS